MDQQRATFTTVTAEQPLVNATTPQQVLQPQTRLGAGRSTAIAINDHSTQIAVATAIGLYLYDATTFTQTHFWPTTAPVQSVAFAAGGAEIAFSTAGELPQLYRWRLTADTPTITNLDESLLHGLTYSPDGAYLVGVSFHYLTIWETATMTPLVTHEQPGALTKRVIFSPDSNLLAVLYKETLELWQVADGVQAQTVTLDEGHYFSPETATFTPDGQQIVAAGLREAQIYSWRVTAAGKLAAELPRQVAEGVATVADLQFSPDATQLVVGLTDGRFTRYPLSTPAATPEQWQLAATDKLAWSADGTLLALGNAGGAIELWQPAPATREQTLALPPHAATTKVTHLFFAPDAGTVTAALNTGALYQWRVADGALIQSMEQHSLGRINSVASAVDGINLIVGTETGLVQRWDPTNGSVQHSAAVPAGAVDAVAVDPIGQNVAVATSQQLTLGAWADPVYWWPNGGTTPTATFDTDDTGFLTTCGIFWNSAIFSADGAYLATSAFAHKALLWRVADGALLHQFEGHTSAILDLALSPDGSLLATASDDEAVRLWQTADGELRTVLPGHTGGALSVAFAPDGQSIATRSAVGDLRLWPVAGGDPQLLMTDVRNPRTNLTFSPDGAVLATGGQGNRAYLLAVANPEQLYVLEGHNGPVNEVAFTADGAVLATASDDGTVALWPLPR
jgi:WD40 repeat protein